SKHRSQSTVTLHRHGGSLFRITYDNPTSVRTADSVVPPLLNLPRNLAPDFTHYISERPEMSSQRREIKESQNKKEKLIIMKTKIIKNLVLSLGLVFVLGSAIT